MKKVAAAVGLTVLVIYTIKVAYDCHFQYHLHKNTESRWERDLGGLESRLKIFESQAKSLEERKVRNLKPFHLSCEISTTDQPAFTTLNAMPSNT
ncbi:MAG: hypothetical protein ABIP71_10575, partial [Verrucomicrobiota bacterium]